MMYIAYKTIGGFTKKVSLEAIAKNLYLGNFNYFSNTFSIVSYRSSPINVTMQVLDNTCNVIESIDCYIFNDSLYSRFEALKTKYILDYNKVLNK